MNLPAGLNTSDLEIFRVDISEPSRAIKNGIGCEYLKLPDELRKPFRDELASEPETMTILHESFQLEYGDEMEDFFVGCRYGALNKTPDLKDGKTTPDIPVCTKIGECPAFGHGCKAPTGKNGTLTRREYQASVLVAKGFQDKEIAEKLNIQIPTVRTHIDRVRSKLSVNNRIEIALWLYNQGL